MRCALFLLVTLPVWVGLATPAAAQEVQEVVPAKTVQLSTPITVISDDAGDQFGSGSGSLIVYEETRGTISYVDLVTRARGVVPKPDGYYDLSPEVHNGTIVFTRAHLATFARGIYAYTVGSSEGPRALAGADGGYPDGASIGTGVVAWRANFADGGYHSEIVVHDLDSSATQRLTTDDFDDFEPTVSADGTVVSWTKCLGFQTDCTVWVATRDHGGVWSARSLAAADTPLIPSSNGSLVTWHQFQGTGADAHADVVWTSVAGGPVTRLVLPGTFDYSPRFAGSLVAYTRHTASSSDVWVYDMDTGINYQLTNSPGAYKWDVGGIWRDSDGTAHVVWSAYNLSTGWDIHMTSFRPLSIQTFTTLALFQQDRSYKLGSVVPLRLQLLDEAGDNASAPGLIVTATGLLKEDSSAPATIAEDTGNANPDGGFRYDANLKGYVFNLSTRGLTVGTWHLLFTVTGDPATYRITFHLR